MWKTTIGLEIHAQLKTNSKIFSSSPNNFGDQPNTNVNLVDLAMPGALPVLNEAVLELAIRFGLAVGAKINQKTLFSRKHYLYPDLPKGYQITQSELPIVEGGVIDIRLSNGSIKTIRLNRAHLEEDAGKNSHDIFKDYSAVDLNRVGVPLLEIVTEPDMSSKEEALEYIQKIHKIVKFIDICTGNMFEGAFRCDVNISVKNEAKQIFGNRVEIKNLNSFKFIERAIDYEVERQIEVLEGGSVVARETRLYDSDKNETQAMRKKEEAMDYRYFSDPDLPIYHISDELIASVKASLRELPEAKQARFLKLGVSENDTHILMNSLCISDFFDEVSTLTSDAPTSAKWVVGEVLAILNKSSIDTSDEVSFPISSRNLADIILKIKDGTISTKMAKDLFLVAVDRADAKISDLIKELGMEQVSDEGELVQIISDIIAKSPEQHSQYKDADDGKRKRLIGYFVGQVMQATKGKANPAKINAILSSELEK